MNSQLINTLITIINVLVCLGVIIVLNWQQITQRKKYRLVLFILIGVVFCLLIWNIISHFVYPPVINLVLLLSLGVLILRSSNGSKSTNKTHDDTMAQSALIEQAKEQERSRIYANLHDDVGAKLLELIYTVPDEKSKKLAKSVLQNIRQAVASTVNIQCTCQQLIEEIISETKMRLSVANIECVESKKLHGQKQKLPSHIPSVITRIMREATSNIIKHSQATQVEIIVTGSDKKLTISIKDNGIGMKKQAHAGKGLKTIKKRAKSINAEVEWLINNGTNFIFNYSYVPHKSINN